MALLLEALPENWGITAKEKWTFSLSHSCTCHLSHLSVAERPSLPSLPSHSVSPLDQSEI